MTTTPNDRGLPFAKILRVTPASAACNPKIVDTLYVRPGALADLLVAMAIYVPPFSGYAELGQQLRASADPSTLAQQGTVEVVRARLLYPDQLDKAEFVAGTVGVGDTIWHYALERSVALRNKR